LAIYSTSTQTIRKIGEGDTAELITPFERRDMLVLAAFERPGSTGFGMVAAPVACGHEASPHDER